MRLLILLLLLGFCLQKPRAQTAWKDSIALAYQLCGSGKYQQAAAIAAKVAALPASKIGLSEKADANSLLGLAAMANGGYKPAILFHQKALKLREKQYGKTSRQAAWSCQNLGICHAELGAPDKAIRYFERALVAHLPDLQPDTVLFLKISIADCYRQDRATALKLYTQSFDFAAMQQQPECYKAKVWAAMGRSFFDWGDFGTADSLFQKSLAAAQTACDEATEGNALFNLGRTKFAAGRTDEAVKYLRLAARIQGQNPPELAATQQSLAYALLQSGEAEAAHALLDSISAIYQQTPLSHDAIRAALAGVSHLFYSGNLAAAIDSTTTILDMLGEIDNPPTLFYAAQNLLGDIFMAQKTAMAASAAVSYYEAALAAARLSQNDFAVTECLLRLSNGYLEAGDFGKSKAALSGAIHLLDTKLPQAKGLRALSFLLSSRLAFVGEKPDDAVQWATKGLQELDYPTTNQAEPFTVLSLLHQKAKSLRAASPTQALPAYRAAEVFLENWASALKAGSRAELESMYYGIYEGLIDCLLKTGHTEEAFLYSDKSHAGSLTINLNTPALDLSRLKQSLAADMALVEYFWGEEQLFAFVARKGGIAAYTFPITDSLRHSVIRFYDNLGLRPKERATLGAIIADAHFVFDEILSPFYTALSERCAIVPSGLLHLLPFEALMTAEPTNDSAVKDFPFLLKEKTFSYEPSAAFWLACQLNPTTETGDCFAFMPVFKNDPRPGITLLANSRHEIPGISESCQFRVFQEKDASLAKFEQVYPQARVLHLSTHAAADPDNRDDSYIAFSYQGAEQSALTVADLLKMKSHAEMVVLSACETNLAQIYRGEGAWSLTRAFLHGGSQSVVSTLWKADDPASAKLMTDFYAFLKKGNDKDRALALAKRKFLEEETEGFSNWPYYWSSFVVVGGTNTIDLCGSTDIWPLVVLTVMAALVIIMVAWSKTNLFRLNARIRADR